jgi:hypothetical protein
MLFAIALRLGMTVHRLEREMPARELWEWIRYFNDQSRPPAPASTEGLSGDQLATALGA